MRRSVRAIVFNGEEDYSATIRADLLGIPGVQIVAEVDEISLIDQAIAQFPAELLVVHLDPVPEMLLPAAAAAARDHPEIAVLVISENADGQLVLAAMRAGVREFLTKPVDRALVAATVDKLLASQDASVERGRLIAILGTIGGAGASMLAVNLATELCGLSKKRAVALVDLDFRYGQLGTMLDVQADYTIADLCDTPEQLDAGVVAKAMVKHDTGIHLLARPNQFAQADQITAAHCAAVLASLQQMYEFVVVDGPNRFDPGGLSVLDLADVNLMVIQLLVTSVRSVHRMLDELRQGGYNLDRFKLICNRVGRESAHLEIGHVEETLKHKVAHQIPDDWKTVSSAINMGVPLISAAPKSKVRMAIHELAEVLADPEGAQGDAATGKNGLFKRIFSGA